MFKGIINRKNEKIEIIFVVSLFVSLWIYLIIRANTVFYIHDEIVTKWAYMISWNPLPYMGYIDANNHFLNSFLGGLFIRLFQSDAIWIVRLGNLLAFPLFFWAIFGLRNFFTQRTNFYLMLISLTCTAFIIEFFGMARGYGMSVAFMILALQQTLVFFKTIKLKHLIIALMGWILAVISNLTLISVALFGLAYLAYFLWRKQKRKLISAIVLAMVPIGGAIYYAFYLKNAGKLYGGGKIGFFNDTVHSLTSNVWDVAHVSVDIALVILFVVITVTSIINYLKSKNLFEARLFISLFFLVAVCNVLFQSWFLGVLFPEDRAALYLVILFFTGFCFSIDYWKTRWLPYPFILLTLILFGFQINLSHFILFDYEHFDKVFLTKTRNQVEGIPPSMGGHRDWEMDNEMTRGGEVPFRALQLAATPSDTLVDYIITNLDKRPDILNLYSPLYHDEISALTLYERNHFLPRTKIEENSIQITGAETYYDLYNAKMVRPLFLRCSGFLENMDNSNDVALVFSVEDSITQKTIYYQGLSLIWSCPIQENGEIHFDFTFAMNNYGESNRLKVYFWNKRNTNQKGEIKLEVYAIH